METNTERIVVPKTYCETCGQLRLITSCSIADEWVVDNGDNHISTSKNFISTGGPFGWECPRCGMVWAPSVEKCDCKPPILTYGSYEKNETTARPNPFDINQYGSNLPRSRPSVVPCEPNDTTKLNSETRDSKPSERAVPTKDSTTGVSSDKHSRCAETTTKSSISKAFNNLEEKKESNREEPFNWANVDWSNKGGTISIPGYFHDY